jgi:hypothetical protein
LDGGPLATLGGATGSRIAGGNLSPTLGGPKPGAVTNVMQTISLGNGSTIQVMNSGLSLPEGTSENSGGR